MFKLEESQTVGFFRAFLLFEIQAYPFFPRSSTRTRTAAHVVDSVQHQGCFRQVRQSSE